MVFLTKEDYAMPASLVTEYDQYLFGKGTHYDLYNKLGAHPVKEGKEKGNNYSRLDKED